MYLLWSTGSIPVSWNPETLFSLVSPSLQNFAIRLQKADFESVCHSPVLCTNSVRSFSYCCLSGLKQLMSSGCRTSVQWAGSFTKEMFTWIARSIVPNDKWVKWQSKSGNLGLVSTVSTNVVNQSWKVFVVIHPLMLAGK